MRKILIGLGALVAIGVAAFFWVQNNKMALIKSQIDRNIEAMLETQTFPASRFEVVFCGTGSPQYNPDRGQPCLGVIVGGRFFLFDAGQGSAWQLTEYGLPFLSLDTIFITHLHSDHMSGVADVIHTGWIQGRTHIVDVVGPPGTDALLDGIYEAYKDDVDERVNAMGEGSLLEGQYAFGASHEVDIEADEVVTVFDEDGILIQAFKVDHPDWSAAFGYRVDFGGKSIVISGDTKYTKAIGKHAQGVDYLIHEVINMEMMRSAGSAMEKHGAGITPERLELIAAVHTPTLEVAQSAVDANAKTLVLTHLIPPIPASTFVESAFVEGMDKVYEREIIVARDGMRLTLIE